MISRALFVARVAKVALVFGIAIIAPISFTRIAWRVGNLAQGAPLHGLRVLAVTQTAPGTRSITPSIMATVGVRVIGARTEPPMADQCISPPTGRVAATYIAPRAPSESHVTLVIGKWPIGSWKRLDNLRFGAAPSALNNQTAGIHLFLSLNQKITHEAESEHSHFSFASRGK